MITDRLLSNRRCSVVLALLAALAVGSRVADAQQTEKQTPPEKKQAEEPEPIELQPYRVRVSVGFGDATGCTPAFRSQVLAGIHRVINRTFGRMWVVDSVESPWIHPPTATGLGRMTPEAMLERFQPTGQDKVFGVTIGSSGAAFVVAAREWDAKSRTLSDVAADRTPRQDTIGEVAVRLLRRLFRPHLELFRSDFRDLEFRVQAGEFPAADPAAEQVRKGDVLIPYFRYREKRDRTRIRRVQMMPLTYIVVERVDRGRVLGTILTGVNSPFGGRARRIDQWAFRQRPRTRHSKVRLVLQTNPDKPLLCHRVEVVAKLRIREQAQEEPLKLLSDRYGMVKLEVRPDFPTVWLYVYSGKALLARVPYAPGLRDVETVELPDDSIRLGVEGEIELMKGRLIDTVARRAVHMSAAKKFSKANQWDKALAELETMLKLPGLDEFKTQLTTIRVPALEAAKRFRVRSDTLSTVERRVTKHCDEIDSVLVRFFNPEREQKLRQEVEEIRSSAADGQRR